MKLVNLQQSIVFVRSPYGKRYIIIDYNSSSSSSRRALSIVFHDHLFEQTVGHVTLDVLTAESGRTVFADVQLQPRPCGQQDGRVRNVIRDLIHYLFVRTVYTTKR